MNGEKIDAPLVRTVDQLPATPVSQWPNRFWAANAAADERVREFERLVSENRALRARLDELTDGGSLEQQVRELGRDIIAARSMAERFRAERDQWRAAAEAAGVTL